MVKIAGFEISVTLTDTLFYKYYYDISDYHWDRISTAALALSDAGIGPKVLKIVDDDDRYIVYERVDAFDDCLSHVSKEELITKITALVDKMHSIGYGHGDLHQGNLGCKDGNIFVLDHDTVYKISEGETEWLKKWMEDGFDWDGTFEEFVDYDYDAWRYDDLS